MKDLINLKIITAELDIYLKLSESDILSVANISYQKTLNITPLQLRYLSNQLKVCFLVMNWSRLILAEKTAFIYERIIEIWLKLSNRHKRRLLNCLELFIEEYIESSQEDKHFDLFFKIANQCLQIEESYEYWTTEIIS